MLEDIARTNMKHLRRTEHARHPFSKKKLRIIDSFLPEKRTLISVAEAKKLPPGIARCPSCDSQVQVLEASGDQACCSPCNRTISKVHYVIEAISCPNCSSKAGKLLLIEPDAKGIDSYQVICCASCSNDYWYFISN